MQGFPSEAGLRAWVLLSQADRIVLDAIDVELQRRCGLSAIAADVLDRLARAPAGALRMQDLAHRVLLSQSGTTRLIERLEGEGLVTRRGSSTDRRSTLAAITPQGRRALGRARPAVAKTVEVAFGRHLSRAHAAVLCEALALVLHGNGRHSDGSCAPHARHRGASERA